MKHATSFLLFFIFLSLSACGGGSSDSGGGGDTTTPESLVGTYTGTFNGRGTNANGPFTCSGKFQMTISQSGSNLVVRLNVDPIVITPCNNVFNFSGSGNYNSSTGAVSMTGKSGNTTISINGTASEKNEQVTMSGSWSQIETNSSDVIASGTWTATKQ